MDNEPKTSEEGYGKRPLWQWIVIYLIIGAVVYTAIYYFAFGGRGGYKFPASNSAPQSQPQPPTY